MRASLPTLAAIALATLSLLAIGAVADECNGNPYGTAGQFDFYVFAQSWPAEFCYAHSSWPGCQNPTAWQKVNLTLHGMWPNYNQPQQGHGWPQCCPSAYGSDIDPAVVSALLPDLQTYWPNEQNPDPTGSGLANSLWQHEWGKHGTCSGLPQKQYMMTAMGIELNIGTPAVLSNNVGGSAQLSDIQAAFNATGCAPNGPCWAAFQCSGAYFAGITTCWDQQLNQIMCPAAVLSSQGQQCSGSTVQISSF